MLVSQVTVVLATPFTERGKRRKRAPYHPTPSLFPVLVSRLFGCARVCFCAMGGPGVPEVPPQGRICLQQGWPVRWAPNSSFPHTAAMGQSASQPFIASIPQNAAALAGAARTITGKKPRYNPRTPESATVSLAHWTQLW